MKMNGIKVKVPGKIILGGEHSGVHYEPMILTSMGKYCTVTAHPARAGEPQKANVTIISEELGDQITLSPHQVEELTQKAQEDWENFIKTGDAKILKNITAKPIHYPVIAIGETAKFFGKKVPTATFQIDSKIPIGEGLGSSAAIAVSMAAATATLLGENPEPETINKIAFNIEQRQHGTPSGGDPAIVTFGKLLWFQKQKEGSPTIEPLPFSIHPNLAENFVIVNSGRAAESTGELIQMVKNLGEETITPIFKDQGQLVTQLKDALKDGNEERLIKIIKAMHRNLDRIGVVSPPTQKLIHDIENAGGAAKISGAGGATTGSGTVIAYHPNTQKLKEIVQNHNFSFYDINLGVEGLTLS